MANPSLEERQIIIRRKNMGWQRVPKSGSKRNKTIAKRVDSGVKNFNAIRVIMGGLTRIARSGQWRWDNALQLRGATTEVESIEYRQRSNHPPKLK